MLARLTRQRDMLKIEGFFNTFRERVACDYMSILESGLLLRRVNVTNTMLGQLNVQWDLSDYRDVNGIKLPVLIRTSDVSSYDTMVRRFS